MGQVVSSCYSNPLITNFTDIDINSFIQTWKNNINKPTDFYADQITMYNVDVNFAMHSCECSVMVMIQMMT